jgi:hypothetical protein
MRAVAAPGTRRGPVSTVRSFLANCRSLPAQFVDTNVCDQFYSKKCCGQTIHGKASRHALAD